MIYNLMFYGGLVLFILFLIATVALFFYLKIPKALGVITGQTQKKAIEEIRAGGRASTSKRGKGSAILARDVGGSSEPLKTPQFSFARRKDEKRSSDASGALAEKAAKDAKLEAARAMAEKARKKDEARESESTEVLTYNEAKKKASKDTGEETTSILEEEQATAILSDDDGATDVLTSDGSVVRKESPAASGDDDATDVLKSTAVPAEPDESEEEATDILKARAMAVDLYDDDLDEEIEEDKTDVLTTDMESKFAENEIYGTYNPEMTAVLKSDMTPGEDSLHRGAKNVEGITILYSETIVHTDECL